MNEELQQQQQQQQKPHPFLHTLGMGIGGYIGYRGYKHMNEYKDTIGKDEYKKLSDEFNNISKDISNYNFTPKNKEKVIGEHMRNFMNENNITDPSKVHDVLYKSEKFKPIITRKAGKLLLGVGALTTGYNALRMLSGDINNHKVVENV